MKLVPHTQSLNQNVFKGSCLKCTYYQRKIKKFEVKKTTNKLRFTSKRFFTDK